MSRLVYAGYSGGFKSYGRHLAPGVTACTPSIFEAFLGNQRPTPFARSLVHRQPDRLRSFFGGARSTRRRDLAACQGWSAIHGRCALVSALDGVEGAATRRYFCLRVDQRDGRVPRPDRSACRRRTFPMGSTHAPWEHALSDATFLHHRRGSIAVSQLCEATCAELAMTASCRRQGLGGQGNTMPELSRMEAVLTA